MEKNLIVGQCKLVYFILFTPHPIPKYLAFIVVGYVIVDREKELILNINYYPFMCLHHLCVYYPLNLSDRHVSVEEFMGLAITII